MELWRVTYLGDDNEEEGKSSCESVTITKKSLYYVCNIHELFAKLENIFAKYGKILARIFQPIGANKLFMRRQRRRRRKNCSSNSLLKRKENSTSSATGPLGNQAIIISTVQIYKIPIYKRIYSLNVYIVWPQPSFALLLHVSLFFFHKVWLLLHVVFINKLHCLYCARYLLHVDVD